MRHFFRQIRFNQLLCTISKTPSAYSVFIDGPASILENSSGYGMKIANFFKSISKMQDWKLLATIKIDAQKYSLLLNSDFIVEKKILSVYYPKEFEIFKQNFEEKSEFWKISDEVEPFSFDGKKIIVPDFIFINKKNAQKIQIELFHKWHKSQLFQRLADLKNHDNNNFILGIDRNLQKSVEAEIDGKIRRKTFRFSDFPTLSSVERVLEEVD
jgi:predicted nuclease of restriction endonuclease-like RecB superfamily